MVAKSYQGLQQNGEPFKIGNKMYVNVVMKSGAVKQVRWYSDAEYKRLYPDAPAPSTDSVNQKLIFGFTNGYITLFKGDTYTNLEWFKQSNARYATHFGWYVVSTEEVPEDLPSDITPIRLEWEAVAKDETTLKSFEEVKEIVEVLLHDPSPSVFVGAVGDRIEVELTVQKAIPIQSAWGVNTLHVMVDEYENVYTWTTAARQLVEGNTYLVRGRVKGHDTYKGTKQTALTRCMIGE